MENKRHEVVGKVISAQNDKTITILVEKNKTNKWLALTLKRNEATVSRWCTNENQPSLETLYQIAQVLDIDIRLLLNKTK